MRCSVGQCAGCDYVNAGQSNPDGLTVVSTKPLLAGTGNLVHRYAVVALPMPVWSHAKHDWPVRRLLINRSVAVVAQLISVVFESLPKLFSMGQAS